MTRYTFFCEFGHLGQLEKLVGEATNLLRKKIMAKMATLKFSVNEKF